MRRLRTALIASLTCSGVLIAGQNSVAALPYVHAPQTLTAAELPIVKTQTIGPRARGRSAPAPVRGPRRGGGGNAAGAAVAAGFLGIIAGGIIASQAQRQTIGPRRYYDPAYDPNYYPPQSYPVYEQPVTYAPEPRSRSWYDYCAAKYRSFDPRSGTFLGRDGVRYYCQ